MFRRLFVLCLLLALALSFWTAPAAAKAETFHFSFKGLFAEAAFSSIDETGCIETFVFVFAQEGKLKADGKPETVSEAFVDISRFNFCTEEFLFGAFGFTTLADEEFVIDKQLNQATLNTTIVVEEFVTGTTFPVDVSVSWTGEGAITNIKDHFQIKEPGFKLNARFMGNFRAAQASGTVSGMGENFTPEPAIFADMGDVKSGELVIFHGF